MTIEKKSGLKKTKIQRAILEEVSLVTCGVNPRRRHYIPFSVKCLQTVSFLSVPSSMFVLQGRRPGKVLYTAENCCCLSIGGISASPCV